MKNVLHEILSEIHHILSIASPEDLRAAAKLASASQNMKSALEALAKERSESMQTRQERLTRPTRNSALANSRAEYYDERKRLLTGMPARNEEEQVYKLLTSSPRFDKRALRRVANEAGLSVDIDHKDNAHRVARKIARATVNAGRSQRIKLLEIISQGQDKQTQGWIDVIKGT